LPSNDFGGQEPGAAKEINATAHGEYHVTFRFTEKLAVKGKDAHPFYRWAAEERPLDAPRWNFHKYPIGQDGHLRAAFSGPNRSSPDRSDRVGIGREIARRCRVQVISGRFAAAGGVTATVARRTRFAATFHKLMN